MGVSTGSWYVAIDWLLAAMTCSACISNLVVLRSRRVTESPTLDASRRIGVVAWGVFSGRLIYLLTTSGDLRVPLLSELMLLMLAFSSVLSCVGRMHGDSDDPQLRTPVDQPRNPARSGAIKC